MFKRRKRCPSEPDLDGGGHTPSDLPPKYWWARDELVDLRMRNHELMVENHTLSLELVKMQIKVTEAEIKVAEAARNEVRP